MPLNLLESPISDNLDERCKAHSVSPPSFQLLQMFAMFIIISISYYLSKYIQYKHNEKPFEVVYLHLFTPVYICLRLVSLGWD